MTVPVNITHVHTCADTFIHRHCHMHTERDRGTYTDRQSYTQSQIHIQTDTFIHTVKSHHIDLQSSTVTQIDTDIHSESHTNRYRHP